MLDIIAYILIFLFVVFYISILIYEFYKLFKINRYKPFYNYDILDYADEIKKRTGISKFELKRIISGHRALTTHQLIAISEVMGFDLNYLICTYTYRGNEVSFEIDE